MVKPLKQVLSGWGNYPVQEACVFRPERWRELLDIVKKVQGGIISRGLGRSYGDAALNAGGAVLLHVRLRRLLDFDPETAILECESGVSLAEILDVFLPRGYFLPVTPGTKYVSVGGAIAADVHGKNHHRDGSFAAFVIDFRLLTAGGEIMICSRETNPEVFWATIGGMGLTGVILTARFRLLPVASSYLLVDYRRVGNLDETLEHLSAGAKHYSVAWVDCLTGRESLGRAVLMQGNHASVSDLAEAQRRNPLALSPKPMFSIPYFMPVFNRLSVRAFNAVYYSRHSNRQGEVCHYEPFFYPLDSIADWNRLYGKSGFVQYQVAFDGASSRQGLTAVLEQLTKNCRVAALGVLKGLGPGNQGLLSFPRPGYTLSVDFPNTGSDLIEFITKLDATALRYGGRVYLAKDACLDAETFAAMYPNLKRFRSVKRQLDPQQRFRSSLARRLGLVETR